ncbi:MAG TPA: hypothetical protein VE777_18025, partial [Gaiellales bacterium]|nr:hypothetical protein [Gaiellales bacterium]
DPDLHHKSGLDFRRARRASHPRVSRRLRARTGSSSSRGDPADPADDPTPPPSRGQAGVAWRNVRPSWRSVPIFGTLALLPLPPAWRLRVFLCLPEPVQARAYAQVGRWARRDDERQVPA